MRFADEEKNRVHAKRE
jgi:hypothetical protein